MNCQRVLEVLSGIVKKTVTGISAEELSFLAGRDLIVLVPMEEFQEKSQDAENLALEKRELGDVKTLQTGYRKMASDLRERLDSGWHNFWSKKGTIVAEKAELEKYSQLMVANGAKIEQLKTEVDRLEKLEDELDKCVRLGDGYAALGENGSQILPFLKAGISKMENRPYEEFEKSLNLLETAIKARRERFMAMYNHLRSEGFDGSLKVSQLALSLSGLEGAAEEIWKRAEVINDFLYEHGWKSYDRLRIVSSVASLPGDIHELRDKLEEIFGVMTQGGHSKCYATWSEAAALLKIPSGDAAEKFQRYEDMRDALSERGWRKGSAASCIIAANLSQRSGEVEDIADEFRTLEKELVKRGRNDCTESGIASLILMSMKGTLDEKVDRFTAVFKVMKSRHWGDTDDYPAAAVLALTPGTPEENVLRLAQTRKWLKEEGFASDLTMRSATLVAGCFRDFMRQYLSSPAALEGLRDSGEDIPDSGGDPLLAAAIVLMLDGDPLAAGVAAMASGNTLFGVVAGMALSPDIPQAEAMSTLGGEMEIPSLGIPEQVVPELNILENLDLNLAPDIVPDIGIDMDALGGLDSFDITADSFLGDLGGGLLGD